MSKKRQWMENEKHNKRSPFYQINNTFLSYLYKIIKCWDKLTMQDFSRIKHKIVHILLKQTEFLIHLDASSSITEVEYLNPIEDITNLPEYLYLKQVKALKIAHIDYQTNQLIFDDINFDPIKVSKEYMLKHQPKAGGYYIQYDDGCESWAPVDIFKEDYIKIN